MNKPLKIFITYAHKDKAAKDKLISYLGVMEKKGEIKFWDDNEIRLGDKWYKKISNNLVTSDILFYFVSAASLASENCNRELAEALSAKIRVIPIILERCDWLNHQLSDIQVLPVEGKPINEWFPDSRGWQNVVENIQKAIDKIQSQAETSSGRSKKEQHAELAFQQGNVLMMLGQVDRAIEIYADAIKLNPNNTYTYNNRGAAYGSKNSFDRAIADYTRAIELNPNYVDAYLNRGVAYGEKGDYDRAIADYTKAIQLKPDFAEAYINRGAAYLKAGKLERVVDDYNRAIEFKPDYADGYLNRGMAYGTKGDYDRAIADYTRAIELNPNYVDAYLNRGVAYGEKGDYDRAIADYTKAIQLHPDLAKAYTHRGVAYHEKGEIIYAIQDYSMAIGLNPEFAEVYAHRGNVYLGKIDIHRAIEDYNAAIKLNSDAGLAYGNCGVAWLHLQQWGNAKVDLTVAIILRVNISALFHQIYKSVADFEQRTGIRLPEDIAAMLNPQVEHIELKKETRLALALKGYETGELSTGLAARLAGMPYSEFLLLMGQHELSPVGETAEELASDFANAHKASDHQ